MEQTIQKTAKKSFKSRRCEHEQWWQNFWNRSYIHISQNNPNPGRVVPENNLPVLIGVDQSGANRFAGKIGSASVTDHLLSEREIVEHYKAGISGKSPAARQISKAELPGSVTVEAWVKPQKQAAAGGRIIDNCSPGGSNGFILDTYPANSLRFIVGKDVIIKKNCLKEGIWQHVAATVDASDRTLKVYLDGKKIAETDDSVGGDTFILSRAYTLQRFIDACAGRGSYPIKFNGSIFTVPAAA
jgi:hypothetical protein